MEAKDLKAFWSSQERTDQRQKYSMLLGAGFILGIVGPYDTSNIPEILIRFAYWLSLLGVAAVISCPGARWYFNRFPKFNEHAFGAHCGYCVIISLPIFPIVMGFDIFFGPGGEFTFSHVIQYYRELPLGVISVIWWFLQVFIITFLVFGAISLTHGAFRKTENQQPAPSQPKAGQRFLNRLPEHMGNALRAITVEDHYVRAFTEKGDTLLLMRFSDAISELEDYPGMQVHRSWWVSSGSIEKVTREKRRHTLTVTGGLSVPVSGSHVEKLRELGLL